MAVFEVSEFCLLHSILATQYLDKLFSDKVYKLIFITSHFA